MNKDQFSKSEYEFPCNRFTDEKHVCQCNCHLANANCSYNLSVAESLKFRELLFLHLDIIEEQQIKLEDKERRIQQLRAENDQLNARLNRMERRVALKIRKNVEDADTDLLKHKSFGQKGYLTKQRKNFQLKQHNTLGKFKRSGIYGSGVLVTSRQFKNCGTGMLLKTDCSYLHSMSYSSYMSWKEFPLSAKIPVPCWKDISAEIAQKFTHQKSLEDLGMTSNDEQIDDESYLRRHSKMEIDEIRRKRWDIQQLRQEKMQENLKQRQKSKDDNRKNANVLHKKERILDSLNPVSENVMAVEVADEVPVVAFGSRIPKIDSSEFELPWFDVAKKEIQYRQKSCKVSRRQKRRVFYKS